MSLFVTHIMTTAGYSNYERSVDHNFFLLTSNEEELIRLLNTDAEELKVAKPGKSGKCRIPGEQSTVFYCSGLVLINKPLMVYKQCFQWKPFQEMRIDVSSIVPREIKLVRASMSCPAAVTHGACVQLLCLPGHLCNLDICHTCIKT